MPIPNNYLYKFCTYYHIVFTQMGSTCSTCWPEPPPAPTLMKRPTSISYREVRSSRNRPELQKSLTVHEDLPQSNRAQEIQQASQKTIVLPDGSKYVGQLKCGIPHGIGTQYHINDDKYTGSFVEGIKEGKGRYQYANGIVYEGDFKDGEIQGFGRMEWPNQDWYEGGFRNSNLNGYGKYYSKINDSYYEGTYLDGKRHGKGTITSDNNSLDGYWELGVFKFKKVIPFDPR